MKIIHVINSLRKGGAEGALFRLCLEHKKNYREKLEIIIITLFSDGFYEQSLKKKNIKILSLKLKKSFNIINLLKKILYFRKIIKKNNPDIIQTWMYHSNFFSIFLPSFFYNKIYWNIRHSNLNFKISKKITILISYVCGLFSDLIPKKIIYCSKKSIDFHENIHNYSKKKTSLIYNGYNYKEFYQSNYLRKKFRLKYKLNENQIVLGFAGRYSKQKNIDGLLIAFSKLIKKYKNIFLLMVGKDINNKNSKLNKIIKDLNITKQVYLLDHQKKLINFYNGIDILLLPSYSESFPNVIAESMLCCTPVVSSNVGCSKIIVNKYGFILNSFDTKSLARFTMKVLDIFIKKKNYWALIKKRARTYIKKNFSINKMSENYIESWLSP